MAATDQKLTAAVETYFADLGRAHASGGATGERSSYRPLANLLNAAGAALKPRVFCVQELADQGAGHPDFGLYAAKQVQKGQPREGQTPERGVVEVKAAEMAAHPAPRLARSRDRRSLLGFHSICLAAPPLRAGRPRSQGGPPLMRAVSQPGNATFPGTRASRPHPKEVSHPRTGRPPKRLTPSPDRPPGAVDSRPCSTLIRRSPASPRARCARSSPPSPFPPPRTDAT